MIFRLAIIAAAIAAVFVPLPPRLVEERYSRGLYLLVQPVVTSGSNLAPFALLDVFVAALIVVGAVALGRNLRRRGIRVALARAGTSLALTASILYLVFLASWGFNYQRVPLEEKLDYEAGRVNADGAIRFATIAVRETNAGHAAAHETPFDLREFENRFIEAQQLLGADRYAAPGRAKVSLLQVYFRWTAINGMTVPGFLEVILHPDLLPVEVPFTLAHEWAHLAGYADESEANFFAWLTCVRSADPVVRYSGWLETYGLALQGVPRSARAAIPKLEEGPQQDLRAIRERLERSSPRARHVARDVYDSYLKANRVEEGIRSYDAALRLMLGTRFEGGWKPAGK